MFVSFFKSVFGSEAKPIINRIIIEYFGNTLNVYFFLSHKWWILLIKYMVGSTTYVRGMSIHFMCSQNIL